MKERQGVKEFQKPVKPNPKIITLSSEDRRILAGPTLQSQMPFTFPVTNFTLTAMSCECVKCGKEIPSSDLFAELTQHFRDQLICVDARGICRDCNLVSKFYYSVDSSGKTRWKEGEKEVTGKVDILDENSELDWFSRGKILFSRLFQAFF